MALALWVSSAPALLRGLLTPLGRGGARLLQHLDMTDRGERFSGPIEKPCAAEGLALAGVALPRVLGPRSGYFCAREAPRDWESPHEASFSSFEVEDEEAFEELVVGNVRGPAMGGGYDFVWVLEGVLEPGGVLVNPRPTPAGERRPGPSASPRADGGGEDLHCENCPRNRRRSEATQRRQNQKEAPGDSAARLARRLDRLEKAQQELDSEPQAILAKLSRPGMAALPLPRVCRWSS